jgi:hypothetical protein
MRWGLPVRVPSLMAAADGGKDIVPFALEVGPIGMEFVRQSSLLQHLLAGRDVFRKFHARSDGDDREFCNYVHRITFS